MQTYTVYKYQRIGAPPNKGYIGWTSRSLKVRNRKHIDLAALRLPDTQWKSQIPFSRALRKHGCEAFDLVVLETQPSKEAAKAAEIRLIAEHGTGTRNGGYNATSGGDGSPDVPDDTRRRMIAARKAAHAVPEAKARVSELSKARWADPEYKARVSAAISAARSRPDQKALSRTYAKAQWEDPEYKAYMGDLSKERWADAEYRTSVVTSGKPSRATPEYKTRIGTASRTRWADPEYKARLSAALSAGRASPEWRARQSAAVKAAQARKKAA